jgi:hypothetical protein
MVIFNINFGRKEAVFFVAFFVMALGISGVIAYNPNFFGGVPSEFGHSSDEVMVKIGAIEKTLQEAINNNDFGAGGGGGSGIETFGSGELAIVEGIDIGGQHGLTKVFGAEIWLVNKVAEYGYSPGDEVLYSSGGNQGNSQGQNQYAGASLRVSGGDIFARIPSGGINIIAAPDGNNERWINYSNWRMVIRAWGVGGGVLGEHITSTASCIKKFPNGQGAISPNCEPNEYVGGSGYNSGGTMDSNDIWIWCCEF